MLGKHSLHVRRKTWRDFTTHGRAVKTRLRIAETGYTDHEMVSIYFIYIVM